MIAVTSHQIEVVREQRTWASAVSIAMLGVASLGTHDTTGIPGKWKTCSRNAGTPSATESKSRVSFLSLIGKQLQTIRTTMLLRSMMPAAQAIGRIGTRIFSPLLLVSNLATENKLKNHWVSWTTHELDLLVCVLLLNGANTPQTYVWNHAPYAPSQFQLWASFDLWRLNVGSKVLHADPWFCFVSSFAFLRSVLLQMVQHKDQLLVLADIAIHQCMVGKARFHLAGMELTWMLYHGRS